MAKRGSCLVLLVLAVLGNLSNTRPLSAGEPRGLDRFRPWLEEVDPLMTPREREAFLGLDDDSERQAFIQQFWHVRDPYPETPRNELEERWQSRLAEVHRRWGSLADDRARVYLLQGDPVAAFEARCGTTRFEVWDYQPRFRVRSRSMVVFTGEGPGGAARFWHPGPNAPALPSAPDACANGARLVEAGRFIRLLGDGGYDAMLERTLAGPKPREWVSSFKAVSVEAPAGASALQADIQVYYPVGPDGKTLARVLVLPATPPGEELYVNGQVLQDGEVLQSFRYRFATKPLVFERPLPPGLYTLRLKVEDPDTGRTFVAERELAVPEVPMPQTLLASTAVMPAAGRPAPQAVPAAVSPEVTRLFAEADAALASPRPGLRIVPPPGTVLAGNVRFEARVEGAPGAGERIERVSFALNGKPLLVRNRPPYEVRLDLGPVPRPHTIRAEGLAEDGTVLARHELAVNAGRSLSVRLLEPRPGKAYSRSLRALAEVETPAGEPVERVELYLGEIRVATLYQPPFAQPIALPGTGEAGYVRAVAFLRDGASAEDLVLLNAPTQPDAIDVRLVELYATVADAAGRLVQDLAPGDFRIFEDGVAQRVRQAEPVADTPLRVVTLLDTSASMQGRLEDARQAALQFLRRTLRPQDQAAIVAFNRAPRVVTGLTGDLAVLEDGLSGLVAEDETSLYDSLIFSLYYLAGVKGQRAVLLLSDGLDRTSDFSFAAAEECARRSGIAVYFVGLDLPVGEATKRLTQLAAETGGRSFLLKGTAELAGVYETIEHELRSQYRIAYQSSNTETTAAFRTVRLEVGRNGLEARTISGYYP